MGEECLLWLRKWKRSRQILRERIAYRSSLANLAALNTFTYPSSYSMKRLGAFYPNGTGCFKGCSPLYEFFMTLTRLKPSPSNHFLLSPQTPSRSQPAGHRKTQTNEYYSRNSWVKENVSSNISIDLTLSLTNLQSYRSLLWWKRSPKLALERRRWTCRKK